MAEPVNSYHPVSVSVMIYDCIDDVLIHVSFDDVQVSSVTYYGRTLTRTLLGGVTTIVAFPSRLAQMSSRSFCTSMTSTSSAGRIR
jgi:hypothetical protein